MLKSGNVFLVFILLFASGNAQKINILTTGRPVSLRGLSVVSDEVIWVSGSGGTVGLSTDGGKTWKWNPVKFYENTDFRDIEAFSVNEAVIMGITEPAVILRTADGGTSWTKIFEDSSKNLFLDAMDFSGDNGIVVGDPVDGRIFFAETVNRGKTWNKKIPSCFDTAAKGESFFAASGSNCLILKDQINSSRLKYFLVSGGKKSCLYISSGIDHVADRVPLLMDQGKETTGANSIGINPSNPDELFIVGGDFSHDSLRYGNSLRVSLYPFIQTVPPVPPHGYRSCVAYLNNRQLICCGTSGVDYSDDGGLNWKLISGNGFHVCRKAKKGNFLFLAGAGGTIARIEF